MIPEARATRHSPQRSEGTMVTVTVQGDRVRVKVEDPNDVVRALRAAMASVPSSRRGASS